MLDFYPEGGERVKGVEQLIAFKLTDGTGLPVEDTLSIFMLMDDCVRPHNLYTMGWGRSFYLPTLTKAMHALMASKTVKSICPIALLITI